MPDVLAVMLHTVGFHFAHALDELLLLLVCCYWTWCHFKHQHSKASIPHSLLSVSKKLLTSYLSWLLNPQDVSQSILLSLLHWPCQHHHPAPLLLLLTHDAAAAAAAHM